MKKNGKRLLGCLAVACFTLALAVPAFATENEAGGGV